MITSETACRENALIVKPLFGHGVWDGIFGVAAKTKYEHQLNKVISY